MIKNYNDYVEVINTLNNGSHAYYCEDNQHSMSDYEWDALFTDVRKYEDAHAGKLGVPHSASPSLHVGCVLCKLGGSNE